MRLAQLHRNLIVHPYLYYELDSSIIPDTQFDAMCREMRRLHKEYPEEAKQAPYYDLCREFETCGSGFFLRDRGYPPELVDMAFHVLYTVERERGSNLSFSEFVGRFGRTTITD